MGGPKHELSEACIMTPHVIDPSSTDWVNDELPDETRRQGFHRRVEWVRCSCGEQFDGRRAMQEAEEHVEEQD